MNILELVVKVFPVASVPELILSFLAGDNLLDSLDAVTMSQIFTRKYVTVNGPITCTYLDEGCTVLHSFDDEPARIFRINLTWYFNGKKHRDGDKPSYISAREQKWHQRGFLYREDDKPTSVSNKGTQKWHDEDGNLHRDGDKPAIITDRGTRKWYQRGEEHRDNGKPAVIYENGAQEWYVYGKQLQVIVTTGYIVNADGTRTWFEEK